MSNVRLDLAITLAMTKPNYNPPGASYKVTRRTFRRRYFFVPKPAVVQLWKFVLAVGAQRHGILLHSVVVLSNHWHAELTDPRGELGEFLAYVHGTIARAMNAYLGRTGPIWKPGKPSVQRIVLADDLLPQAEYILLNPVRHRLTSTSAAWPGLVTLPSQIGTSSTVRRPGFFFDDSRRSSVPKEATFEVVEPAAYVELYGPGVFTEKLGKRVQSGQRALADFQSSFLGRRAILATDPWSAPNTPADTRGRGLDPKLVCSDSTRLKLEIQRLKDFRSRYGRARRLWLRYAQKGRAVFPHGTYAMRRFHGCQVEPPPELTPSPPL